MYSGLGNLSSGSFWAQRNPLFTDSSPLDDILDGEHVQLEDVLDEETVIQEAKGLNEKVIKFLSETENLKSLVGYATSSESDSKARVTNWLYNKFWQGMEPESIKGIEKEMDEKGEKYLREDSRENALRISNFPFVACEIICCNSAELLEKIVSNEEVLACVFSKLEGNEPIEARVAGYINKLANILILYSPERMLWYSVYGNVDISEAGASLVQGGKPLGWLISALVRHVDSYSIACVLKTFCATAADDGGGDDGDMDDSAHADSVVMQRKPPLGINLSESQNALLHVVRSIWLGGSGTALKIMSAFDDDSNSDANSNAADIIVDMFHRATTARLSLQDAKFAGSESPPKDLPTFSGFILKSRGQGPFADIALVEAGVEWTTEATERLVSTALCQHSNINAQNEDLDEYSKLIRFGSAPIASLHVLIQLVNSFGLERWTKPTPGVIPMRTISHIISAEAHAQVPAEIQAIVSKIPQLLLALTDAFQVEHFHISSEHASKNVGMYRIKIVELLCMLIHSKYPEVIRTMSSIEPNPLDQCLDLFFKFEWNNALHSVLDRTMHFIFLGGVSEESMGFDLQQDADMNRGGMDDPNISIDVENESKDEDIHVLRREEIAREQRAANEELRPLQECLFIKCKLIDRLVEAYKDNQRAKSETEAFWACVDDRDLAKIAPNQRRCGDKGNMGFCHRIVNTITLVAASQRNYCCEDSANRGFADIATSDREDWSDLLQDEIMSVNAREQLVLGGERPNKSAISQSDPDDFYDYVYEYEEEEGGNQSPTSDDVVSPVNDDDMFDALAASATEKLFIGENRKARKNANLGALDETPPLATAETTQSDDEPWEASFDDETPDNSDSNAVSTEAAEAEDEPWEADFGDN